MKTIWRSLRGPIQQFFGVGYDNRTTGQPVRWTVAERILLPLAALLILLPIALSYLPGRDAAPAAARGADVTIDKSASPDSVSPGQQLNFTITVANNMTGTIDGVRVDDALPDSVTFGSAKPSIPGISCGHSGNNVSCQGGTLAPGQTGTVLISTKVSMSASGDIQNTASVFWRGGQQEDSTVVVPVIPLTSTPTDTPVPPTDTAAPATDTPVVRTGTPAPATDTPVGGTTTAVPPTDTPGGTTPTPTPTFRMPPTF